MTPARPLPAPRVAPRHLRADGTTRPAPVPPAWFRTTSTVFSALKFAGLLRPAAGHEVRRVSPKPAPATPNDEPPGWSAMRAGVRQASLLATPSTLRRVPLARSRTVSPRPAPSVPSSPPRVVALPAPRCRSAEVARSESDPRLRGLAPRTSPLRPTPFRAPGRSFLPWACVLFVARLPPLHPGLSRGDPKTRRPPSGRPSHGGDTPRWSRGHPSHAVGRSRRGSLSGGVVRSRARRPGNRPP